MESLALLYASLMGNKLELKYNMTFRQIFLHYIKSDNLDDYKINRGSYEFKKKDVLTFLSYLPIFKAVFRLIGLMKFRTASK